MLVWRVLLTCGSCSSLGCSGGFAAGVGACAVGFVTLRRGEVDLSTGELYEGEPVPVKLIALATSGVVVALSALLAWPLGAYGWLSDQLSPCHALVSLDLLSELSESDLEVGEVQDSEGRCLLRLEDGARLPAVTIIVHDDDWSEERDGGHLRLFLNCSNKDDVGTATEVRDVAPIGGRLVVFRARDVPHAVLPVSRARLAMSCWHLMPDSEAA